MHITYSCLPIQSGTVARYISSLQSLLLHQHVNIFICFVFFQTVLDCPFQERASQKHHYQARICKCKGTLIVQYTFMYKSVLHTALYSDYNV